MRWAPSSPGALDPCAGGFSEVQQCPQGNGCESPGLELSPWLRSAANTGIQRESLGGRQGPKPASGVLTSPEAALGLRPAGLRSLCPPPPRGCPFVNLKPLTSK